MVSETTVNTVILGLGATGLSVARWLHARGEPFAVADTRPAPPGAAALRRLDPAIPLHCGELADALLNRPERLVVSPGIALDHPALMEAHQRGIELLGDIELFARTARAPIIAITGSNGKSTVTSLVAAMARSAGLSIRAGGNLGPPALDLLRSVEPDYYILELSSFQLERTYSLAPAVAAVLNVSADHLDRHASLDDYASAKAGIYKRAGIGVINRDDEWVTAMATPGEPVGFGLDDPAAGHYGLRWQQDGYWLCRGRRPLIRESALGLAGRHNTANALATLALGTAMGLDDTAMVRALAAFTGLAHRSQWVAESNGVTWYNDSKATNVGATCAALQGMAGQSILIAGGEGKGADFSALRPVVAAKARAVVLLGRDAKRMARALHDSTAIGFAEDMHAAVKQAARCAHPGDNVLLSPACASFDQYADYAARGEDYMAAVRALAARWP